MFKKTAQFVRDGFPNLHTVQSQLSTQCALGSYILSKEQYLWGKSAVFFAQCIFPQKNCGIFCKIVSDAQMIAQKFAFCLATHIILQIFSGKRAYILAL